MTDRLAALLVPQSRESFQHSEECRRAIEAAVATGSRILVGVYVRGPLDGWLAFKWEVIWGGSNEIRQLRAGG